MILKLRNRHRYTWIGLATLLPIGFVAALANRPTAAPPNEKSIGERTVPSKVQAIASAENEDWRVALFLAPDGKAWLEARFKRPPRRPLSTLYLAPRAGLGPKEAQAVGAVNPQGTYRYALDGSVAGWPSHYLFCYDLLRRETYAETQLTKSR